MYSKTQNKVLRRRLSSREPLVVLWEYKNRDGPLIYHRADGPQWYRYIGYDSDSTGPPKETGPPIKDDLIYRKTLQRNSTSFQSKKVKKIIKLLKQEYLL